MDNCMNYEQKVQHILVIISTSCQGKKILISHLVLQSFMLLAGLMFISPNRLLVKCACTLCQKWNVPMLWAIYGLGPNKYRHNQILGIPSNQKKMYSYSPAQKIKVFRLPEIWTSAKVLCTVPKSFSNISIQGQKLHIRSYSPFEVNLFLCFSRFQS